MLEVIATGCTNGKIIEPICLRDYEDEEDEGRDGIEVTAGGGRGTVGRHVGGGRWWTGALVRWDGAVRRAAGADGQGV